MEPARRQSWLSLVFSLSMTIVIVSLSFSNYQAHQRYDALLADYKKSAVLSEDAMKLLRQCVTSKGAPAP